MTLFRSLTDRLSEAAVDVLTRALDPAQENTFGLVVPILWHIDTAHLFGLWVDPAALTRAFLRALQLDRINVGI